MSSRSNSQDGIYEPAFVQKLFDEMAGTYGLMNQVSSFGFSRRWRRRCVRQIELTRGSLVVDLMTGMGELCPDVSRHVGPQGRITAVDISPVMCARARRYEHGRLVCPVDVLEADAVCSDLATGSADVVISSFGLKTFSAEQTGQLAREVHRILKPGGLFSFVEISVPRARWFRALYMFYLKRVIPKIGRLMLGNPDNYRLLGIYTEAFQNCAAAASALRGAGLEATEQSYFFGCATGICGRKPNDEAKRTKAADI